MWCTPTGATYGNPWPQFRCARKALSSPKVTMASHAADLVFLEAHQQCGFPVTILKPNTTYGSIWRRWLMGQLPGTMLHRMIQGKPVVLVNDGQALHHFLSAADCAKAFVFCLGRQNCFGQVYNCSSIVPYTWRQWVQGIMDQTGLQVPIVSVAPSDLRQVWPELPTNAMWDHMIVSNDKIYGTFPSLPNSCLCNRAWHTPTPGGTSPKRNRTSRTSMIAWTIWSSVHRDSSIDHRR